MRLGPEFFRDQRIGCFLNTVVQEPIGMWRAENEARSDGRPKAAVQLVLRGTEDYAQ